MRPSIRFEVLKRDDFTCVYCGRRSPDVELEVDHILPRKDGGTDDIENLTTACKECNRGKSARSLTTLVPVRDLEEETRLIVERQEKLRKYIRVKSAEEQRLDAVVEAVTDYWIELWTGYRDYRPFEGALRKAAEILPVEELLDAVDVALINRRQYHGYDTCRYFGGVLKRKIARAEGRVVLCERCQKDVVLDDPAEASKKWWHRDCYYLDHPDEQPEEQAG